VALLPTRDKRPGVDMRAVGRVANTPRSQAYGCSRASSEPADAKGSLVHTWEILTHSSTCRAIYTMDGFAPAEWLPVASVLLQHYSSGKLAGARGGGGGGGVAGGFGGRWPGEVMGVAQIVRRHFAHPPSTLYLVQNLESGSGS
jgi:hypothetical protein